MVSKHHWSLVGYDAEELYFDKVNRELIEKIKSEREKEGSLDRSDEHLAEVITLSSRENASKKAA